MHDLINFLEDREIEAHPEMRSIVLVGGKGTRLNRERKVIDGSLFPQMSEEYYGQEGPKGLALLQPVGCDALPLTDWHLEIHERCTAVESVSLALGCCADMMENYYSKCLDNSFRGLKISYIPEKNPAGTLAPLLKLYSEGELTNGVYVYANGDNLADIDLLDCYRKGTVSAIKCGIPAKGFVIDIAALVPWEESASYGTLDMDFDSGLVRSFKEKCPIEENAYIEKQDRRLTPINSGFSIIVNPLNLIEEFLDREVIEISRDLEEGVLDYKGNEKKVKYETFYEKLAAAKRMTAVLHEGYWTDLGTEEKIQSAEENLPEFFTESDLG